VEEVRSAFDADSSYPPALFVHSATTAEAKDFFEEFWPEARAVSDPEGRFYEGFRLESGSLREIFGPGVWIRALQAMREGHLPRKPIGNVWLMPGIFYVEGEAIRWSWRYRNMGDHPDFGSIPRLVR
jgi:hypothetical protein